MDLLGRSSSRIRREAADWVARLGTHPGEAELARFKSWHDSDPRHAEAYARIAAIWDGAAKLQRPLASDQPPFSRPVRRFAPAMAAVAAMLIVGLVLAPGLLTTNPPLLLISAAGERRLVELAGGTTIHLEPSSRVEVTLGRRDGRLDLK